MQARKNIQSAGAGPARRGKIPNGNPVDGIVVEKNLEEGKIEVGYMRENGHVGSKFEMYNRLDALTTPSQPKTSNYSIKKNLFPMSDQSQKKLTSTLSPKSEEKRSPSGKRNIHIEPSTVALNQDDMFRALHYSTTNDND